MSYEPQMQLLMIVKGIRNARWLVTLRLSAAPDWSFPYSERCPEALHTCRMLARKHRLASRLAKLA